MGTQILIEKKHHKKKQSANNWKIQVYYSELSLQGICTLSDHITILNHCDYEVKEMITLSWKDPFFQVSLHQTQSRNTLLHNSQQKVI